MNLWPGRDPVIYISAMRSLVALVALASTAQADDAIRAFGKANFLVISDGRAKIQVYVRQDSLPPLDFQTFKLLDFGDWIGAEGRLFRTKTNELTIWASRLQFLSKCLNPDGFQGHREWLVHTTLSLLLCHSNLKFPLFDSLTCSVSFVVWSDEINYLGQLKSPELS